MNPVESDELLTARVEMAEALRSLGHALVGHRLDEDLAGRVATLARELHAEVTTRPERSRLAELAERWEAAVETGDTSEIDDRDPLTDGEVMDLFRDSIVSGRANPMSIGLRVQREGDGVVGKITFGPAHEGAPTRAHGGMVSAVIDELMGFVMPLIGEVAYTANLNIDYVGPTPVHEELTIHARLRDRSGRKLWVEAHGESDDGVFVRAEALFLTVDVEKFAKAL